MYFSLFLYASHNVHYINYCGTNIQTRAIRRLHHSQQSKSPFASLHLVSSSRETQTSYCVGLSCWGAVWVEYWHYLICRCHLISPAPVPVTLTTAISIFCPVSRCVPHCVPLIPVCTHSHIHSKGSPRLSSSLSLPPSPPSSISLPLSLPPSAESHSGSLDQTLQRSRQRKVPSGAQLPIWSVTLSIDRQPWVSDTFFIYTAALLFKDLGRLLGGLTLRRGGETFLKC